MMSETQASGVRLTAACPESEYSPAFLNGMLARMAVSYHKYGPVGRAYPHKVDALKSLEERLRRYRETGNTEWLIDVANFAMIEFLHPAHDEAHFRATDSDESPGRRWHDGGARLRDNEGERPLTGGARG